MTLCTIQNCTDGVVIGADGGVTVSNGPQYKKEKILSVADIGVITCAGNRTNNDLFKTTISEYMKTKIDPNYWDEQISKNKITVDSAFVSMIYNNNIRSFQFDGNSSNSRELFLHQSDNSPEHFKTIGSGGQTGFNCFTSLSTLLNIKREKVSIAKGILLTSLTLLSTQELMYEISSPFLIFIIRKLNDGFVIEEFRDDEIVNLVSSVNKKVEDLVSSDILSMLNMEDVKNHKFKIPIYPKYYSLKENINFPLTLSYLDLFKSDESK